MSVAAGRAGRPDRLVLHALRALIGLGLVAALAGLDWVSLAPNRLVPGQPVSAAAALGLAAVAVPAFVAAAQIAAWRGGAALAVGLILAALAAALATTGAAAATLLDGRPPAARVMLGSGFWVSLGALAVLALDHARDGAGWLLAGAAAGLAAVLAGALALGLIDHLSLVVEYGLRREALARALAQHVGLSLAALALAAALVVPLGVAAFHRRRVEWLADAALGAVQVTPSIALFGLLIPLLAGLLSLAPALRSLGIGAIGPAPAVIGVAVYVALPLLRGVVGGLRAADPAAIEAARALGFREARITAEVRVPLALPILVGALRVATVQSVGLMTLGGLIGAGGLGALVFEGMAQFAADLILLGALPIVGLALAADVALAALSRRLEARR